MHKTSKLDNNLSDDPRSIRARQAFRQALKDLLKTTPFSTISVTDIAKQAGFARHTFYNHYETKEDLLHDLVDSVLEKFFSTELQSILVWETAAYDSERYKQVGINFLKIWQENIEIVKILDTVDIDCLLINRLRDKFLKFFYDYFEQKTPDISPALAEYFVTINAYVYVGVLKQWFRDGMKYPPEVLGELLDHFAGVPIKKDATNKFGHLIR